MTCELVVIGTSLGGLTALETIFKRLKSDFGFPVAVVQHRSPDSLDTLLPILRRSTGLRFREPEDKEEIAPSCIYVAPPDYHLLVERGSFALSTDNKISYARPSIDVLFETAANSYGSSVVGIALTGANSDGAHGATRIKARGGKIIVQDPTTAESPVLPKAVLQATTVDAVLSLSEIADYLASLCDGSHNP